MGFWGSLVVARSATSLTGLDSVQALGGEPDIDEAGADGWHILRLYGSQSPDEAGLRAVTDELGGPVLVADVLDSDTAMVRLAAPRQGLLRRGPAIVTFFLHGETARVYGLGVDDRAQARAPEAVVAWAGGGDVEAVHAVVTRKRAFAEDSVLALAAAFGAIAPGELSEWTFSED